MQKRLLILFLVRCIDKKTPASHKKSGFSAVFLSMFFKRNSMIAIIAAILLLSACSKKGGVVDITEGDDGTRFSLSSEDVQVRDPDAGEVNITVESHGNDVIVSRALAAKMLTMALYDLQTIDSTDREITFTDTSKEDWYDKYINSAFVYNLMTGVGDKFLPNEPVTLFQTQVLLDKLDPNNRMKLEITDENKDKPVSYALFADLYKRVLENMSGGDIAAEYGVSEQTFVVLASPLNTPQLSGWDVITDKGPATCFGVNLNGYIDKEIKVLKKDGDVLAVLGVESETPTIKNALVTRRSGTEITVFSGGCERTYLTSLGNGAVNDICDIKISGGKAEELTVYTEKVKDVVNCISQGAVEFKNIGDYPLDEHFKVYSAAGGSVKWRQINNLLVGTDIAEFYIENGVARAAVIVKNTYPNNLRVLIGTTGFTGFVHSAVTVSATRAFTVSNGSTSKTYEPWEAVVISADMFNGKSRLYVSTSDPEGKIVIPSVKRSYPNNESPRYRGTLEISRQGGGYVLVNEVGLEEYLYAVVPSEMPSGFGVPASKVQAITARSYAYEQFYANRFYDFGANIDDSVTSQVYNNIPENEVSIAAVNETKGQFLAYNGSVVSANFFSTSAGTTANSGEVWASAATKQFPAQTPAYLKSASQLIDRQASPGDLSNEETATAFFKNTSLKAFDSGSPWFRWNTVMTASEISASINHSLKTRYSANPSLIKTLQADNVFRSKPIDDIGAVKDITVRKRGEGGNITSIIIKGEKSTILVETEYNIRLLIAPFQRTAGGEPIKLNLADGTAKEDYTLMPSAFFTIDKSFGANGGLTSVKFYGGGNGHGAGMSQYGAKGMLDLGYTVEQVLKHYYAGTEVVRLN